MTDLIAGHIPVMFAPVSEAAAQANNAKVRLLAVSSIKRSLKLPDVPTIAESGFEGFDAVSWTGLMAPAGTPKEIVDKLGAELVRAVKDPKFVEQIVKAGNDPLGYGPDGFAKMIASEIPIWGDAVKSAGVKLN
jgi:tripartite-type tricarboxylate transporter receptor subunit TctC